MLKAFRSSRMSETSRLSSARSCSLFSVDCLALVASFKSYYSERTIGLPGFVREFIQVLACI